MTGYAVNQLLYLIILCIVNLKKILLLCLDSQLQVLKELILKRQRTKKLPIKSDAVATKRNKVNIHVRNISTIIPGIKLLTQPFLRFII